MLYIYCCTITFQEMQGMYNMHYFALSRKLTGLLKKTLQKCFTLSRKFSWFFLTVYKMHHIVSHIEKQTVPRATIPLLFKTS